jgi:hypothetical protein
MRSAAAALWLWAGWAAAQTLGGAADAEAAQGSRELTPRIVGGTPVPGNSTEFFWLASLQSSKNGHYCGGSLIAPSWVVTAAHCVYKSAPPDEVLLGLTNLDRPGKAIKRTVTRVVIHELYGKTTNFFNDIALLQLSSPVTTIAPVPLVDSPALQEAPLTNVVTAGWGVTKYDDDDTSTLLREVTLPLQSYATCTAAGSYSKSEVNQSSNLCAGLRAGGKDSCSGDSGGPLVFKAGSALRLIGIVSWGEDCAKPLKYGLYTKVSTFKTWIAGLINPPTPSPAAPTTAAPVTPSPVAPASRPTKRPTPKPTTRMPTRRPTRKPTQSPTRDYSSSVYSSSPDPCSAYPSWQKCLPHSQDMSCWWNPDYWLCETADDQCLAYTSKASCTAQSACRWLALSKKAGQCQSKT